MISGVLVVDKAEGPTSHDLVRVARRVLDERRIGHCGTLDPMATGVLALAIGQATRLVQFLSADRKHYDAAIRFGLSTTTYDITGEVVAESPARPTEAVLLSALDAFRGTRLQRPPAFSAKKVAGVRAHDLARRDARAEIALDPVAVTIHDLALTGFDGDVAKLRLVVSAGFYVRSLAHDLGEALGTGGALASLRRTRAGHFGLEEAISAEALAMNSRAWLAERVLPPERLLPDWPAAALTGNEAARARRGLDFPVAEGWPGAPPHARILDDSGRLLGLAVPADRPGFLHPSVVLG
jgi:tRNA pseudouridine55 synthase